MEDYEEGREKSVLMSELKKKKKTNYWANTVGERAGSNIYIYI